MAVNKNSVVNIAGYKFEPLDDAIDLIPIYQQKCDELLLKGTMLISKNGINFSVAGTQQASDSFIDFIEKDNRFLNIPLKVTYSETQPFRRMKVRLKKEIISLGRKDINPREMTGEKISPEALKNLLDTKEEVLVLDTRNEYETRVGKFENAIDLNLDTFRDFPKAIESLPEEYKDKQIVMYCTGGIRCEKASAVMMKAGFADVKQLEGGVLDYFKETGGAYWEGDCFVFDERVALDTELNETDYIYCYICREPLSAEEKASPDFKINEYCPYCVKKTV
ncbi:MAG: rhodanese-related sulfurtransferase [Candidatus Actinomarina sp.]